LRGVLADEGSSNDLNTLKEAVEKVKNVAMKMGRTIY